MTNTLLIILVVLGALNLIGMAVLLWLLRKLVGQGNTQMERLVRDELRLAREEAARDSRALREELAASLTTARDESGKASAALRGEIGLGLKATFDQLKAATDAQQRSLMQLGKMQFDHLQGFSRQLAGLTSASQVQADTLRNKLDERLQSLQNGNERRLEQMQNIVDEKLQVTLERRLGESFSLVSERLEAVQRGLGEMQTLATGVGDLKRVLTNVKTRGTWGEIQLGALLEQILTPDQFARNVQPRPDSRDIVEFAVKLPGLEGSAGSCVWLPIDSKFPKEDYERLLAAADLADADGVQKATTGLIRTVRKQAQDIHEKYIEPPYTTDFALLFLPTEGLYAEVLRQPGLTDELQNQYRVVITGPTTLAATLNSLRLGFRTLAIEQRSADVWRVLGAVKLEFSRFGKVLDKVKKQLHTVSRSIDDTDVRTRAMERKLRSVEDLPEDAASELLELPESDGEEDEENAELESAAVS